MSDIEFSPNSPFTFIQNILSTTKCYDIMQNSSKVICICIFTLCEVTFKYRDVYVFIIHDYHNHHHHDVCIYYIRLQFSRQQYHSN